jgi:hypothetical protein
MKDIDVDQREDMGTNIHENHINYKFTYILFLLSLLIMALQSIAANVVFIQ